MPCSSREREARRRPGGQLCGGALGTGADAGFGEIMDIGIAGGGGDHPVGDAGVDRPNGSQLYGRLKLILPVYRRVGHVAGDQGQVHLPRFQRADVHARTGGGADVDLDGVVLLGDGLGDGAARLIHGSAAVRSPDGEENQIPLAVPRAAGAGGRAAPCQSAQKRERQQRFTADLTGTQTDPSLMGRTAAFRPWKLFPGRRHPVVSSTIHTFTIPYFTPQAQEKIPGGFG